MRFARWLIVLAFLLFSATPALAQKRNITEKDLFNFIWIADPQVSPDGSRIAFVRVTVNDKKDGYNTAIWSVSPATGETRQLTNGTHDLSPRWSPDGNYLVFVRVTEKEGRPDQPQLFMLSMAGGESFQFTSLPRGAGVPQADPPNLERARKLPPHGGPCHLDLVMERVGKPLPHLLQPRHQLTRRNPTSPTRVMSASSPALSIDRTVRVISIRNIRNTSGLFPPHAMERTKSHRDNSPVVATTTETLPGAKTVHRSTSPQITLTSLTTNYPVPRSIRLPWLVYNQQRSPRSIWT